MDRTRRRLLQFLGCALCGGAAAGWTHRADAEDRLDAPPSPPRDPGTGGTSGPSSRLPTADDPHVREAYFYESLPDRRIACRTCPQGCVLDPGETGFCRAKANLGGRQMSLSWANPCAIHVDPIEKKPLYHVLPGSKAFSLAVAGCNFRCLNCQNWEIAQVGPRDVETYDLPVLSAVENAARYGCRSIAFTYSEPTSFYEYALEIAETAKSSGIRSAWVSNGYIERAPLERLCRSLSAGAINLKSFEEGIYWKLNSGHLQPVLDTLVRMKELGIWLEVINLVIPTWTDDPAMIRRMCRWHVRALGPDTPLHFSRFVPLYRLAQLPPTPVDTLARAREIALEEGIRFVYIGNVPGMAENTICPGCGKTVIERTGYRIRGFHLEDGACAACGRVIPGVWS